MKHLKDIKVINGELFLNNKKLKQYDNSLGYKKVYIKGKHYMRDYHLKRKNAKT